MKLLKLVVSGYRLLEDGFTIDFLSKARVNALDKEDEIIELDQGLYIPTTTVFTGKNASGKSSILALVELVYELLNRGRVAYNKLDFRGKDIHLEIYFYLNQTIYKYEGTLAVPTLMLPGEKYNCVIVSETLLSKNYTKSMQKDPYEATFKKVENLNEINVSDTSILYNITKNSNFHFNTNAVMQSVDFNTLFKLFKIILKSEALILTITNLFDDNIKHFSYDEKTNLFSVDIQKIGQRTYNEDEVNQILSDGTKKGLFLFALAIYILKTGGTLVIDEIENSFHKNLVENIIMIFNDKRINTKTANMMFSTHYVEILDIFRRRDNIFIMQNNHFITACNLYADYKNRIDLSKSNQFNNNTFQTLINYERLMQLKKALMDEVSHSS